MNRLTADGLIAALLAIAFVACVLAIFKWMA
jgi:hypothetical protein